MNACPAIPTGDAAGLASALASIDCQLDRAVGVAYARLFGHSGALLGALTIVLTLYVAILALGLVTGRARLSLSGAMPRVLALGLVLTFATAWPAYQVAVTDLLARGPDQIASALLGGGSSATRVFVQRLDGLFDGYVALAQALQSQGEHASPNLQLSAKLAWAGSLLLLLATAGLLVMARVVLAILLALGPVFIVFALFRGTRGLFEGWLKTVVGFALAPMLIVLGGAGLVALLSPLLDEALVDPVAAGEAVRPLAMLFAAAVVYVLTLLALSWSALSLTRHWRVGAGRGATGEARPLDLAATVAAIASARPLSPASMRGGAPHPGRAYQAGGSVRIDGIASALMRLPSPSRAARLSAAGAAAPRLPIAADGRSRPWRSAPRARSTRAGAAGRPPGGTSP